MVRWMISGTDRISGGGSNHINYFHAPRGSFTDNNCMVLKKAARGLERHIEVRNPERGGPERNPVFTFLKLALK